MKTYPPINCVYGRLLASIALTLITVATTTRASYQSTVLADNPLAYYPLDVSIDSSGQTATDLSGNGNNGTYNGTDPQFNNVPGPSSFIPNALFFDGFTSYVDLGTGSHPTLLNFGGPIAMEAWVQPIDPSQNLGDILAKGYAPETNDNEIALRLNGGVYQGVTFTDSAGTKGASGGTPTTNWTYVVATYDGTNWSLYVNTVLVQQNPDTVGALNFTNSWHIGSGTSAGASRLFNGNLCQVVLYNHSLSSNQVLNHFFAGEVGLAPSNSSPVITTQPQPQSVYAGGTAAFSVAFVSVLPTTNQWFKNNNPIIGQTNISLTVTNVQTADNYSVRIGNSVGATNSNPAAIILLAAGNSLRWNGSGGTASWDAGSSPNWINLSNAQQTVFNNGDQVLFNDTPGVTTNVTVSGTVSPSIFTVNASTNYLFVGSGTISGPGSLVKNGSGILTFNCSGNFTGPVTINGGTLAAGDFALSSVAAITVTNGATLDFDGSTYDNNQPVIVSGAGVNGEGAIFNSIFSPGQILNISLAGDTTFGGSSRWDLIGGSINGAHNVTVKWSNSGGYGEWNTATLATNVGNIELATGSLGIKSMGTTFGNPAGTFTVDSGTQLDFWTGDAGYARNIHVLSGGELQLLAQFSAFNANLTFENNATFVGIFGGGNQSVNGAITLNGVAHFQLGDGNFIFTNVISGSGGFVWDAYNHQMILQAANTYSGPTVIGNGETLALSGNGSISHSSPIFFGGSTSTNIFLDVSGRPDKTLTLASGQTLGGIGTINGSLTVAAGATLTPAGTNITIGITAGTNSTGTISATNAIVLNGTTTIKLNGSGVNDVVQAGAGVTYGGTLNLLNVSGAPLAAGNSFQIFSAGSYGGSFASLTPATPGTGLAWDTSQLNSGFLNVVAASAQPVISSTRISGGNLIFSGTNGVANGSYSVLTTTNLSTPLTNWTSVVTNTFNSNGGFSVTNAISPNVPRQFYILKQ